MAEVDPEDAQVKVIERHVAQLREHFDSVQIVCTSRDGQKTIATNSGSGNWYARVGSIREWLMIQDENCRETERVRTRGEG